MNDQQKIENRLRARAWRLAHPPADRFCRVCGKNIAGSRNKKVCSGECRVLDDRRRAGEWKESNPERKRSSDHARYLARAPKNKCIVCGQALCGVKRRRFCPECEHFGGALRSRKYMQRLGYYRMDRGPDWNLVKLQILSRDGGKCQECGSMDRVRVHHIIPYRFTFDNSGGNLVTLCASCHSGRFHVHMAESVEECLEILGLW